MYLLRVIKVLHVETKFSKNGTEYRNYRLLVDHAFFDGTTVHPSTKVVYASSGKDFELRNEKISLVYITVSKNGSIWMNGAA